MGTYLCTGICLEMRISKKEISNELTNEELEKIHSSMGKEFMLKMYDFVNNESALIWKLKDSYLDNKKDLAGFLYKQYMAYDSSLESIWKLIVNKITNTKNADEVRSYADDKQDEYFQMTDYIESDIDYGFRGTAVSCRAIGWLC